MKRQMTQRELNERLDKLSDIYRSLGAAFDTAWASVPDFPDKEGKGRWIKGLIINDQALKDLMDDFQNRRPPKFMLIGRTGVGKSSLINALCGVYRAKVSDTVIGTKDTEIYEIPRDGETILRVLDTRGIAEGNSENPKSAEDALRDAFFRFQPDIILTLFNITSRDDSVNRDVKEIQKLYQAYYRKFGVEIPIIAVLTRTDLVKPEKERLPNNYSASKKNLIQEHIRRYCRDFSRLNFYPNNVIAVSASVDWGRDTDELNRMTPAEIETLVPVEDCRYNIDILIDAITSCLPSDAAMGWNMVSRLEIVLEKIARKIVNVFSSIAATVAATPIPFADMPVLWGLEVTMIMMVAAIGGENISVKAAQRFLFNVMGVVSVGFAAQQFSRLLNALFPLSGSACSAAVATGTMKLLGEAAIKSYIRHESLKLIQKGAKEDIKKLNSSNQ